MRDLLAGGRLPERWIPPPQVLECRALLEAYHDLRAEHTAWIQRVHAVLFHQGAPVFHDLSRADAPAELAALARHHCMPDSFSRCPMIDLQPASTTPEPMDTTGKLIFSHLQN